jgi:iron complex transport system ATP-binding protein
LRALVAPDPVTGTPTVIPLDPRTAAIHPVEPTEELRPQESIR